MSLLIILILCLGWPPHKTGAQESSGPKNTVAVQLDTLKKSIEDSIQQEENSVQELQGESRQSTQLNKTLDTEIDLYNVQHTTFSRLLFLPDIQLRNLESAFNTLKVTFSPIKTRLEKLDQRKEELESEQPKTTDQIDSITRQQLEISRINEDKKTVRYIRNKLIELRRLLSQKLDLQNRLIKTYRMQIGRLGEIENRFTNLSQDYEKFLLNEKSRTLLHQDISPFSGDWPIYVGKLFKDFSGILVKLLSVDLWQQKYQNVVKGDQYDFLSFLFLGLAVLVICTQLKRFLKTLRDSQFYHKYQTVQLPIAMIDSSLYIMGAALYFFGYIEVVQYSRMTSVVRVLFELCFVWMVTKWCKSVISRIGKQARTEHFFQGYYLKLIGFIRWYLSVIVIALWLFQYSRFLALTSRLIFELVLVVLGLPFTRILYGT